MMKAGFDADGVFHTLDAGFAPDPSCHEALKGLLTSDPEERLPGNSECFSEMKEKQSG